MNWWDNLVAGSVQSRLESGERASRILKFRQRLDKERARTQRTRDDDQDAQIETLRTELDQVQIALGVLSQLLVDKGVLPREELTELIEMTVAERAGAAKRVPPPE